MLMDHFVHLGANDALLGELRGFLEKGKGDERVAGSDLFKLCRYAAEGVFEMSVVSIGGSVGTAEVDRRCTTLQLKATAEAETGIPAQEQHLFYQGRLLEDGEILACFATPLERVFEVVHARVPKICVFGGLHAGEALCNGEMFDPSILLWEPLPELAKPCAAAAALEGQLMALGNALEPDRGAWALDWSSGSWEDLPPMSHSLQLFEVVALGGKLYVLGGRSPVGIAALACMFDPASRAWHSLPPMASARHSFAAIGVSGRIYAIGGRGALDEDVAGAEAFDTAGRCWVALPELPVPRHSMAVSTLEGCVYVAGGAHSVDPALAQVSPGQAAAAVEALACGNHGSWMRLPDLAEPRRAAIAVAAVGRLLVAGGTGMFGEALATVEVLDLAASGPWKTLPSMSRPRKNFKATCIEGTVYVLGGGDINLGLASVEALDLRRNIEDAVWAPLPPMSQPRGGFNVMLL